MTEPTDDQAEQLRTAGEDLIIAGQELSGIKRARFILAMVFFVIGYKILPKTVLETLTQDDE